MTTQADRASALLDQYGQTFADEAGVKVAKGTPAVLWQLLMTSTLLSSRISAQLAVRAAEQVRRDFPTAARTADARDSDVYASLERGGYLRKDRTTAMLQDSAAFCVSEHGGDLRRLRERADGDVARATELLLEFKGIGEVGAEVFLREVQVVWGEFAPHAGDRALAQAKAHDLPADAAKLAALVDEQDVVRLMAALVRSGLEQAA